MSDVCASPETRRPNDTPMKQSISRSTAHRRRAANRAMLALLAAAALVPLASCGELDRFSPSDDYVGPYRNLAPLPADWQARRLPSGALSIGHAPRAATQPADGAATQLAPTSQPAADAIRISVKQAILTSLENNPELVIQRYNPPIQRTVEQQERAAFDPTVTGGLTGSADRANRQRQATGGRTTSGQGIDANAGVTQFLPTGTTIDVGGSTSVVNTPGFSDSDVATRLGVTATQALLRGAGVETNLARLREARIDVLTSRYELRGFAESLLETVENTYWDYALGQQRIEIFKKSLALAEQQLDEARELIHVGKLAEIELAGAEAEVALRKEDLINARSTLAKTKLALLRLISPKTPDMWTRSVALEDAPFIPQGELDPVQAHVDVAMQMRPDLNQARLRVKKGDLEVVRTKNGLLPKLDLFITLGKTGYADSFHRSAGDIFRDSYDAQAGVRFEIPVENRDAEAVNLRARLTRDQLVASVDNLAQLVEVDVRTAHIEVMRTREQITATAATRRLQEAKLKAETEKFRVGKSTTLLVAQAQRDLLSAQISEIEAVTNYLKSTVTLFRLEGSLLERRGIEAPGGTGEGLDGAKASAATQPAK